MTTNTVSPKPTPVAVVVNHDLIQIEVLSGLLAKAGFQQRGRGFARLAKMVRACLDTK